MGKAVVKIIVSLAVSTVLSIAGRVEAASITAGSCSRNDVGNAVTSASDGDTVQVPAGTCSWTSTLTITKGITLIGAGIGQTIILDDIPVVNSNRAPFLSINVSGTSKCWRVSGMTFTRGTQTAQAYNGRIAVAGNSHCFRLDHVYLDNLPAAYWVWLSGDLWGVIDHNTFRVTDDSSNSIPLMIYHSGWQSVGTDGDNSWATPVNYGSGEFVFIEDNIFTRETTNYGGITDSLQGGRWVFRHNTLKRATIETHGLESGGRGRGFRAFEVYENDLNIDGLSPDAIVHLRSGSGVVYNNRVTNEAGGNWFLKGDNYRDLQIYPPWGKCDGSSVWDQNTSAGYACMDQVGRGHGGYISGNPALPAQWPNQISEPTYVWNNTTTKGVAAGTTNIRVGRDIITSAKPGYTPYTYPHPLVGGSSAAAAPSLPTGVTVW